MNEANARIVEAVVDKFSLPGGWKTPLEAYVLVIQQLNFDSCWTSYQLCKKTPTLQERFSAMTRAYFKGAVGALVVFDLGDAQTYSAARKWKADIDKKCALPDGRKIPAILVANKVRNTLAT